MQVSFGKLYEVSQRPVLTKQQKNVSDRIVEKLENHNGVNMVNLLDDEQFTDVVLTLKKNGNIELKLQKDLPSNNLEDNDCFIPADRNNKQIKTEFNLKKRQTPATITKQLNNFLDRCMNYAQNGGSPRNEARIEAACRRQPELTQAQEYYLDQLEEEDRFRREFHTDRYN